VFLAEETYEWGFPADTPSAAASHAEPLREGLIESKIWPLACSRGRRRAAEGNRPFEAMSVLLLGQPVTVASSAERCRGPTRDVLEAMVRAGGGDAVVVEHGERAALMGERENRLVVACCEGHLRHHQAEWEGDDVVAPTYLLDCISSPPAWLEENIKYPRECAFKRLSDVVEDEISIAKRHRI
jgi:hypothetical protein